ncbi:MAG: TatD family hydrolase [bacterium]|nr:TatD family hydrolase [bacterium]
MSHILTPYLIDTHCHLNFLDFDSDRDEVIKRVVNSGVKKMIVVGVDLETNQKAVEMADKWKNVWAAVGFHPINVQKYCKTDLEHKLTELDCQMGEQKVVALGEIGLDFFRLKGERRFQVDFFIEAMRLAGRHGLPAIIHCRDAFDEVIEILTLQAKGCGVVHCFTGNLSQARRIIDLGFYIGFTGLITYTKDEELLRAVREADLDRIVIETDSPFLAPAPVRGRRNEPDNVRYVAERIAEVRHIDPQLVIQKTTANAERLFRLD